MSDNKQSVYKLGINNRLSLSGLLPSKDTNYEMLETRDIILKKLQITEEEEKTLGFTIEDNVYKWDNSKEEAKEFTFSRLERRKIEQELESLEKKNKLNEGYRELYKMFIID